MTSLYMVGGGVLLFVIVVGILVGVSKASGRATSERDSLQDGQDRTKLGLTGFESYDLEELTSGVTEVEVKATSADGEVKCFCVKVRIDTPKEWDYFRHGGILQYVIRQLLN